MTIACRVTWKHAGRKHAAHGLFRCTVDAALWVLSIAPAATAIVAEATSPGVRHDHAH